MAAARRHVDEPFDHHRGAQPLLRPTGPLRTGLFLAINLAGFVVVNAFWRYLATGRWVEFTLGAYQQDVARPLAGMLLHPLSLLTHPWMILVWGLVLGVVLFVPLIVAVLYRLVFAAPFVLVVAVVGHSPALALAVALGCVLAAYTPLRSDLPFLAVLLGMVPVGAYLFLFGFAGLDEAAVLPIQRWLLTTPLLIALALVAVAAGVVLALARVTGFRPGAIWPVLAVMLAPPMVIFHLRIGQDELAYSLIVNPPQQEQRLAPGDAVLKSVPLEEWRDHNDIVGLAEQRLRNRIEDDFRSRRRGLAAQCDAFLADYPESDRTPIVLWIRAQCASLQLDENALDAGLIRYSASHPLPGSRSHWRRLTEEHGGSPHAALAHWRLGELEMRRAARARNPIDVASIADTHLGTAAERIQELFPDEVLLQRSEPLEGLFSPPPSVPSRRYYAESLLAVKRLVWLMEQNMVLREARAARALADLMSLDALRRDHARQLKRLAGQYEDTPLGDNLKLAVAKQVRDPYRRAEMLIWLAEGKPTDAAIEASYLLGMLGLRTSESPALPLLPEMKDPREYFRLVREGPPSPYTRLAEDRVRWLEATTQPGS